MTCVSVSSWRSCWSFFSGLAGFAVRAEASQRDDRHSQVANAGEQAVQGGLVQGRAAEGGRALNLMREGQPIRPGGPAGIEMALQADLVRLWLAAPAR